MVCCRLFLISCRRLEGQSGQGESVARRGWCEGEKRTIQQMQRDTSRKKEFSKIATVDIETLPLLEMAGSWQIWSAELGCEALNTRWCEWYSRSCAVNILHVWALDQNYPLSETEPAHNKDQLNDLDQSTEANIWQVPTKNTEPGSTHGSIWTFSQESGLEKSLLERDRNTVSPVQGFHIPGSSQLRIKKYPEKYFNMYRNSGSSFPKQYNIIYTTVQYYLQSIYCCIC